jgi:hypothetical protein
MTIALGLAGVLTCSAGTLAEITDGNMIRYYAYGYYPSGPPSGETDVFQFSGIADDQVFQISASVPQHAGFSIPFYWDTPLFTDHVNVQALYRSGGSFVAGALQLDVTSAMAVPAMSGRFTATGTFTALDAGWNLQLLLSAFGDTRIDTIQLYDRDPGFYYPGPLTITYAFATVPEPTTFIAMAQALLVLAFICRKVVCSPARHRERGK